MRRFSNNLDQEAFWMSVRLAAAVSLIVWCYHPAVVEARIDDKVLLISGAVPGSKGGYVIVRPAIKKPAAE